MYFCYILYSNHLDRFYIGATSLPPEERIERHLTKFYDDSKFTAKANDWVLFLSIPCSSFNQAKKLESHIKRMRSRKYINNLKLYPEIIQKLHDYYPDS